MPQKHPKTGDFYYHHKHQAQSGISDYAYQIMGIATHTETNELMVVYKVLYVSNRPQKFETSIFVRPLEMFLESVDKPELNYTGPRFNLIIDPQIIDKLGKI
jgi:hypothetical protein